MTPEDLVRWKRVKDIFEEAADVPEGDRGALLRRHCDGDTLLRTEVEDLLRLHGETDLAIDKLGVPRLASAIAARVHMRLPLPRSRRAPFLPIIIELSDSSLQEEWAKSTKRPISKPVQPPPSSASAVLPPRRAPVLRNVS